MRFRDARSDQDMVHNPNNTGPIFHAPHDTGNAVQLAPSHEDINSPVLSYNAGYQAPGTIELHHRKGTHGQRSSGPPR